MFSIILKWKAHNLCLGLIDEAMRTAYPDSEDLYFVGQTSTPNELKWKFSQRPIGWNGYDENGDPIAPDASSEAEGIIDYWNSLDDQSTPAQNYFTEPEWLGARERANIDAATKTWDNLSTEQKKLVVSTALTASEMSAIITDHPEV